MPNFGLLGRNIDYSFSKTFFSEKFKNEKLPFTYDNFDINNIDKLPKLIKNNPDLIGLNVTTPYKQLVITYLDKISKKAKIIGAVNTIKVLKNGKLKGYNTDCYGFEKSLKPLLKPQHIKALILGTGGASKAVVYVLNKLNIKTLYVSRNCSNKANCVPYSKLTKQQMQKYTLIINCTPTGTFPNVNEYPELPYDGITNNHLLYDLIYNPSETRFLNIGKTKGATVINGLEMLHLQALKSWNIWSKD